VFYLLFAVDTVGIVWNSVPWLIDLVSVDRRHGKIVKIRASSV